MGVVIILTSIFCLLNRPECVTLFHLNYFYTSHCLKGKVHYANLSIKVPHSLATAQFSNIISHQYFLWVYNPGGKAVCTHLAILQFCAFEWCWNKPRNAKDCQDTSEVLRAKTISPLQLSARSWPCWHLDFGLLACSTTSFCCFKPSGFWYFALAALGN